eukprot:Amastigsp_a845188_4.p4 type:complete len:118 gc:universal Amastigsp_a845188_4:120-473(+)
MLKLLPRKARGLQRKNGARSRFLASKGVVRCTRSSMWQSSRSSISTSALSGLRKQLSKCSMTSERNASTVTFPLNFSTLCKSPAASCSAAKMYCRRNDSIGRSSESLKCVGRSTRDQ